MMSSSALRHLASSFFFSSTTMPMFSRPGRGQAADRGRHLADAGGEDEGVDPAQGGGIGADVLLDPVGLHALGEDGELSPFSAAFSTSRRSAHLPVMPRMPDSLLSAFSTSAA